MSRLFLVIVLAFMIYTFVAINPLAKAEIMRTTIDIPVKIAQTFANIMASVEEARAASVTE